MPKELHKYTDSDVDKILESYFFNRSEVEVFGFVKLEDKGAAQEFLNAADLVTDGIEMPDGSIKSADYVVIPVHVYGNHWTAAMVTSDQNGNPVIHYNDPGYDKTIPSDDVEGKSKHEFLGHPKAEEILGAVRKNYPQCKLVDYKHQQQKGGTDCGPFAVDNLVRMVNGEDLYSPKNHKGEETFSGEKIRKSHVVDFPHIFLDDEVLEHVEKIIKDNKLEEIYNKFVLDSLKQGMYRNVVKLGGLENDDAKENIVAAKKVFDQRRALMEDLQRVRNQEDAVKKFKEEGVKASLLMSEMSKGLYVDPSTNEVVKSANLAGVVRKVDAGYLDPLTNDFGNAAKVRKMAVPTHTSVPTQSYVAALDEAQHQVLRDLAICDRELAIVIDEARSPTGFEREILNAPEDSMLKTTRFIQDLGRAAKRKVFGTKEEKLEDSDRLQELQDKRNQLLAHALWSIGPMAGDKSHYIQRLKAKIDSALLSCPDQIFGLASIDRIKAVIDEEVKEIASSQEKFKIALDNKIKSIEDEAKKEEDKLLDDETALMQGRLLMMFLGVTPFGLFANVFGGIFNYPEFLSGMLDEVFANKPLSEKISGLLTSDKLDIFGIPVSKAVEATKIPYALEWLLENTPIVKDAIQVPDIVLQNEIFQDGYGVFGSSLKGIVSGPLATMIPALWYGYYHLGNEVEHASKVSDFEEKFEKNQKDAVRNFEESHRDLNSKKFKELAQKKLGAVKEGYIDKMMTDFIFSAEDESLKLIFGDTKFTAPDGTEGTISDLKKNNLLGDEILVAKMLTNPKNSSARSSSANDIMIFNEMGFDKAKFKDLKDKFDKEQKELSEERVKTVEDVKKQYQQGKQDEVAKLQKKIEELDKKVAEKKKEKFGKARAKADNQCLDLLANLYGIKTSIQISDDQEESRHTQIERAVLNIYAEEVKKLHHTIPTIGEKPSNNPHSPIAIKLSEEVLGKVPQPNLM